MATVASLLLTACTSYPVSDGDVNITRQEYNSLGDIITQSKLDLNLCNTRVTNPPNAIAGRVLRQASYFCVNSQLLLVAPAPNACVTSGFGRRFGRHHHGVDYQAKPAGPVIAAAEGTVVRRSFRAKDFGHWIVLDHGAGVYSAYGHLSKVGRAVSVGRTVRRGQQLGIMGATGKSARGIHLHYEVRVGRLSSTTSFFSLQSVDPFALPAVCG